MTDNRRVIKMCWICSDSKTFENAEDANKHQMKLNVAHALRDELSKVFDIRRHDVPHMPDLTGKFIIENSDTLFAILAKYYKTVDHDEEA